MTLGSYYLLIYWWHGGATGKVFGLAISRSRVQILLEATLRNNLGQVVHTCVPLSPSSITWYRPKGGDALRLGRELQAWRKVMAAYSGWMTYGHLPADCLYTGISSGPNALYRVWEAFYYARRLLGKNISVNVNYFYIEWDVKPWLSLSIRTVFCVLMYVSCWMRRGQWRITECEKRMHRVKMNAWVTG